MPPRPTIVSTEHTLRILASRLGHEFKRPALLQQALSHRSYGSPHNERLEFLGDGVLNCAIAALLFERFPTLPEGDLSRLRANLVNQDTLAQLASGLDLGAELYLGEGELKSGGFRRPSILADALEAIFGAVYVDAGFEPARALIERLYAPLVQDMDTKSLGKDPKTQLQELLQGARLELPRYNIVAVQGEAHEQLFQVECLVPQLDVRVQGEGTSRRGAEQRAAEAALELARQRLSKSPRAP